MILCDNNIWLALALSKHSGYPAVRRWFESITEPASIGFCRATQQSFLRLLTTASVWARYGNPPLTNRQAWNLYERLTADDRLAPQFREPPALERYWQQLTDRNATSPKLWMDAYLAAFALAGGYQFVTLDQGFSQFDGLDLILLSEAG